MLARNNSRTKRNNLVKLRHVWYTTYTTVWARRTITTWRWFRLFRGIIEETPRRTGTLSGVYVNSVLLAQVTSGHLTFLLPAIESGIRCSRNDGRPVICIISYCIYIGRLRGLAVACWNTDHYHTCSNRGVGISEGWFIFDFASLPLEVGRPI